MKKPIFVLCLLCCVACGKEQKQSSTPAPRPIKVAEVVSLSTVTKNYAGIVESTQTTNLAFKVAGQITSLPVASGERIHKGDLIAQLDTRDFKLNRDARHSAYITAKAQYERLERLLEKEAVSKHDFEIAQTNYDQAKAELENSENQLSDTRLVAPFDGTIEACEVDNYQRVNVGQTIVRLVDTQELQVKFFLADYNLNALRKGKPSFWVRFASLTPTYYKAELKEYTDISTDGSGIPVKLRIADPNFNNLVVKPGFACDVRVDFSFDNAAEQLFVPLTAVFEDRATGEQSVWVVKDGKLERRHITVQQAVGNNGVAVSSGVSQGEQVVVAGAVTLSQGQEVRIID